MSENKSLSKWIEHKNRIPSIFAAPIKINDNEFILIPKARGISKYNITTQEWIHKFVSYPSKHRILRNPTCTYSKKDNTLFIYDCTQKFATLLIINFVTKEVNIIKQLTPIQNAKLIYCQRQLHLISSRHHLIFDGLQNQFISYPVLDEISNEGRFTNNFGLIYLSSKQVILAIDGDNCSIYSYQTKSSTEQWTKLVTKLPKKMRSFAYTITKNEQYVVLAGGERYDELDEIHIMDTTNLINDISINHCIKINQSPIKCPKSSLHFHAITMTESDERDECLVFGYIRNIWQQQIMEMQINKSMMSFPPFYILKYIQSWYCKETLHLFENEMDPANHWTIDIDDLLTFN